MNTIGILNETLEKLKDCGSNCKELAAYTSNKNSKDVFNQLADNVTKCEQVLQSRMHIITDNTPQYPEDMFP